MFTAAVTGYFTALSLILAIGAQNAFVLRQGLVRAHVFPICLFCATSDAVLIALGVGGFSYLSDAFPALPLILTVGGAIFLLFYGATRFLAARKGAYQMELAGQAPALWPALATIAALTWLNPHVYLDTLGLIGAVSAQFDGIALKWAFGIAAATASFSFFFALGYGARLLAPIMTTAKTWQILDIGIGVVMWLIAGGLVLSLL